MFHPHFQSHNKANFLFLWATYLSDAPSAEEFGLGCFDYLRCPLYCYRYQYAELYIPCMADSNQPIQIVIAGALDQISIKSEVSIADTMVPWSVDCVAHKM